VEEAAKDVSERYGERPKSLLHSLIGKDSDTAGGKIDTELGADIGRSV